MNFGGRKKLIKDNVHEYIYVDEQYFDIIDTAVFQRLKNIKQTSYTSLYPSSTHDRFTHSLGTYHLGKQVIAELWNNIGNSLELPFSDEEKESITFSFEMACLLHDVGHAPFSHTGENFYKVKRITKDTTELEHNAFYLNYMTVGRLDKFCYLDGLLINELASYYGVNVEEMEGNDENTDIIKTFLEDYKSVLKEDSAKPHEKMSALISLKEFGITIKGLARKLSEKNSTFTGKEENGIEFNADLFVRSIIGAKYNHSKWPGNPELTKRYTFYNSIISLLNSDIIDVDKLDYILRDNFMTGYKNTGIDTERLVKSFTVVQERDFSFRLAYKKNALSVIENVILANDSSRRWVQNHPIILYDTYITQYCVKETFQILEEYVSGAENAFEKFFNVDSITTKGTKWMQNERIFLASDLDLIGLFKKALYIAKENNRNHSYEILNEFFDRSARRHPLWKSEMEFRVCFNRERMTENEENQMNFIEDAIATIDSYKDKVAAINECIITEKTYKEMMNSSGYPQDGKRFLRALKEYFDRIGRELDIVIINTTSFVSKMRKLNKKAVYVEMPDYAPEGWNHSRLYSYSELVDVEDGNKGSKKPGKMFYMYSKWEIDVKDFVTYLLDEADFYQM